MVMFFLTDRRNHVQMMMDMDDEDEAVDALFALPMEKGEEQESADEDEPAAMEAIEDDADFTMEDGEGERELVRDELDIGEIGEAK